MGSVGLVQQRMFLAPIRNYRSIAWERVNKEVQIQFEKKWKEFYEVLARGGTSSNGGADGLYTLDVVGCFINQNTKKDITFEELWKQAVEKA